MHSIAAQLETLYRQDSSRGLESGISLNFAILGYRYLIKKVEHYTALLTQFFIFQHFHIVMHADPIQSEKNK